MNRLLLCLLFTLNAFPLTLKEAVRIGLENNKTLLSLKKDVEQAKIKLKISSSLLYPTLNFKESLKWIDKGEFPYSSEISLSLSQYIFKKDIFDEIMERKYELENAELSYQASKIETINEIAKKYIGLLELIEEKRVAKSRIDYLETLFLTAEQRFNKGIISEVDLKEAYLALKEAKIKDQIINERIEITKDEMRFLIGSHSLSIQPEEALVFKPIDIEKDEKIALANRVEIKSNMVSLNKSKLFLSTIKSRLFPTISLNGDYSWSANKESISSTIKEMEKQAYWSVSLLCEIPLFDGGRLKNEIKAARSSIDQQEIILGKTKEEIIIEVKNAISNLNNALKTLELKKEHLSLQEERLRIANEMFKMGRKSLSDVLDEEEKKNNANLDYLLKIADYEHKKLDYYKALGILEEYFK